MATCTVPAGMLIDARGSPVAAWPSNFDSFRLFFLIHSASKNGVAACFPALPTCDNLMARFTPGISSTRKLCAERNPDLKKVILRTILNGKNPSLSLTR